ncbi:MAG: DUF763 domain-containing protein, partial [Planctomycetes bacterium]|nr:DUF763 domain-containing protein [Planctomycetota bacterium]
NEPHDAVIGDPQGLILNLTHNDASKTRESVVSLSGERPDKMMVEARKILLPRHHEVRATDVNLRRLASVLLLAHNANVQRFDDMLLLKGLGPRTMQSLALVSEVIFGTPTRFDDPARFSFAHGGKDGHPFPVPLKVYDESIDVLKEAVNKAKIGYSEKMQGIRKLEQSVRRIEQAYDPRVDFDAWVEKERREAPVYG